MLVVTSTTGHLNLIAVAAIFSLFAPMARFLSRDLSTLQQVYLRTALGALFFLLFMAKRNSIRRTPEVWRTHHRLILLRSFAMTLLGATLFSFAVQHTSIGSASFLGALPSAILWAWILFGFPPSRRSLFASVIATAGAALIFQPALGGNAPAELAAQCAALVSGFAVSFGMIASKLHRDPEIDAELNLLMMISGSLQCALLSLALGEGIPNLSRPDTVAVIVLAAVLIPIIFSLTTVGFRLVQGAVAAVLLMLEIPMVIASAVILFGEWPTTLELIGGTLVLAAAITVQTKDTVH